MLTRAASHWPTTSRHVLALSVTFSQRREIDSRLTSTSPTVVAFFLASLLWVPVAPASVVTVSRVRPISDGSRAVLKDAIRRSPTIKRLMDELQARDIIVYVDLTLDLVSDRGKTMVVTANSTVRILRVLISGRLDPRQRIEVLGHELQHALEIAREEGVGTDESMRDLFLRIGYATGPKAFETVAAQNIEAQVKRDLGLWTGRGR